MVKVIKILNIEPYEITCLLSHGLIKRVNVLPLIEKHSHIAGVEQLKEEHIFQTAEIGELGEIRWKSIVAQKNGDSPMDYDISPEFVMHNGITLNTGFSSFATI